MLRPLLLGAALALAACAASPADPSRDLAFALGVDLSCNASEALQCPPGGCNA
jgi:hypothetical protein